jgi:DNA invertase Pin-like site-specific DNA recombinase
MGGSTENNGRTGHNGRTMRFAAMPRVSTEKQEKQGESLRTQRQSLQRDVELLGGTITGWYGGQESAVGDYERKEMVRLTADAASNKWDAVIIAHIDRWDRGSSEAKTAINALIKHNRRFYISCTEMNLHNPDHQLMLDMAAAMGKWAANNAALKSLLNKIARARRGLPTCGELPFARTYDRTTEQWGLDPAAVTTIRTIVARFLAGESLPHLAAEYGMSHSNLCRMLRYRCGAEWVQEFHSDKLNIHERVPTVVPRLLDAATIRAVHQRLDDARTRLHLPPPMTGKLEGRTKHRYLLSGFCFCGICGRAMTGNVKQSGVRYYRHAQIRTGHVSLQFVPCPLTVAARDGSGRGNGQRSPCVRADVLEEKVIDELFNLAGNPAAIERAVQAATADHTPAMSDRDRLLAELQKVSRARRTVLDLIERGSLSTDEAEEKLQKWNDRERLLRQQLDVLDEELSAVPTSEQVRLFVEELPPFREGGPPVLWLMDDEGDSYAGGNDLGTWLLMGWDDKRTLVEKCFAGMMGGKHSGVYVTPTGRGSFTYQLRGKLHRVSGVGDGTSSGNTNRDSSRVVTGAEGGSREDSKLSVVVSVHTGRISPCPAPSPTP